MMSEQTLPSPARNRQPRGWMVSLLIICGLMILLLMWSLLGAAAGVLAAPDLPDIADLGITKTHNGSFTIGADGVYTLTITNGGADPATGAITVTDVLTDGLAFVSAAGTGWAPCGMDAQTLTCVYSNSLGLASGAVLPPIRLTVGVDITSTNVFTNTASVANLTDANPANNTALDRTVLVGTDLGVTKTVLPASPQEGETVLYTIRLTNNGPNSADSVALTDTLPADLTFISAAASQGTYSVANGRWTVGTLADGAVATLNLTSSVNSSARGKVVVNTVSGLSSDQPDYNSANNTASASFSVASTVVAGEVIDAATDDPISAALITLVDNASRTYTTTTNATGLYTFTGTVTGPIAPGVAQMTAVKSGYATRNAAPVIVANVLNTVDFALDTTDLVITKSDGALTMIAGGTYTYTITVTNQGTITATNVIITDVLSTYMTYISDTTTFTHSVPAASTLEWKPIAAIGPTKSFSFKLRVKIADAMPSPSTALTNLAKTRSAGPEAELGNNQVLDTNTSSGTATPAVTLSVSPTQVRTGQNATYTIKIKNNGTAPATDLTLTDTFSTLVDLVSATTNKGTATTNNTTRLVTVTFALLKPAEEVTVTVIVRVNTTARANTNVSNLASLSYKFDGSTRTVSSNSVTFQLIYSATLPGTGGMQPVQAQSRPELLSMAIAILLGVVGAAMVGYALWLRRRQSDWSGWLLRMGLVFSLSALLFASVAWGLKGIIADREARQASAQTASLPSISAEPTAVRRQHEEPPVIMPPNPLASAPGEVLPEYTAPAPAPNLELAPGEPQVDTSPVNRIVIPILGVDTVVKYIPFDGLTWAISGLQQEVAWMGDTAWPGVGGNTALAGHVTLRNGANGPFRYISDLRYGDVVWVYTEQNQYEYVVEEQRVVEETDLSIVDPSDDTLLTLITCTDWNANLGYYQRRLVVRAALNGVKPVEAETALGR